MFNVESIEELELINRTAGRLSKRARIAFRINPHVDPHTHRYIATGKSGVKFGIPSPTPSTHTVARHPLRMSTSPEYIAISVRRLPASGRSPAPLAKSPPSCAGLQSQGSRFRTSI